jgi:predicted CXXCH cytochrome family protein
VGVGDFHACVGLDEAGLHSTHAITRTHCAALAVRSVARTSLEDDALHARKARRRLVLGRMQRATWQVPEAEEGLTAAWRKEGCTALPSKREDPTSCHEPHAMSQTNQLLKTSAAELCTNKATAQLSAARCRLE